MFMYHGMVWYSKVFKEYNGIIIVPCPKIYCSSMVCFVHAVKENEGTESVMRTEAYLTTFCHITDVNALFGRHESQNWENHKSCKEACAAVYESQNECIPTVGEREIIVGLACSS